VRAALGLAFITVATAAVAQSCQVYDDSLKERTTTGKGGSAGAGGGAGGSMVGNNGLGFWSSQNKNGCFSAGVPTPEMRPAVGGQADVGTIYLAIDHLRLGGQDPAGVTSSTAWEDMGFDLDGLCTDSGGLDDPANPDACAMVEEQGCKATTSKLSPDGRNCRDNTFGRFEGDVSHTDEIAKYRLNDDLFNCALCVGYFSILVKITGYNGTANDDQVRIDLYPSPGLKTPFKLDCINSTSWKSGDLCWTDDKVNTWKVDPTGLVGPYTDGGDLPDAKLSDANAYVRDGYMVMQLPDPALLWFPTQPGVPVNSFPILVHRGVVAAKVQKTAGAWSLTDGTIGGSSTEKEIVGAFRQVGFCETDSLYQVMTSQVHAALDILQSGAKDQSIQCDSLSIGVGFTARQATAGPTEVVTPLTECQDRFATGSGGAGGAGGAAGSSGKAGAGGLASLGSSLHREQLDLEHQGRRGRDDGRPTARPVRLVGADREAAQLADAHPHQALFPALDDPVVAEANRERRATLPRAVERRPVDQGAVVVHRDLAPHVGGRPRPFAQDLDLQIGRRRRRRRGDLRRTIDALAVDAARGRRAVVLVDRHAAIALRNPPRGALESRRRRRLGRLSRRRPARGEREGERPRQRDAHGLQLLRRARPRNFHVGTN
jgi:hypothetical protein